MIGSHCIKSWSKTQAVIAKSSAEAELYGVVRGGTEGLGIVILLADFGKCLKLQLHLDATAAKGIVERNGLSKVRHIDTNVLWLQETCARKQIPLFKIPGGDNCSDLMTKDLTAAKMDEHLARMRIEVVKGRSNKAAKLHMVSELAAPEYCKIRRKYLDAKGGDRWLSRGHDGVWHRLHTTPRNSLFTPYRISKGPGENAELNNIRFTRGITQSGRRFEFHDQWKQLDRNHWKVGEPWIGYTAFIDCGGDWNSAMKSLDAMELFA